MQQGGYSHKLGANEGHEFAENVFFRYCLMPAGKSDSSSCRPRARARCQFEFVYGAISAHSPALLAFGADSFVELLSATVVLLAIVPSFPLARDRSARLTGILLFVLAGVVALVIPCVRVWRHCRDKL